MSSYYIYPRIHTPTYTPTYLHTRLHTYILYMSSCTIHLSSLHVVMLYAPAHYVCVLTLLHVCYYYRLILLHVCYYYRQHEELYAPAHYYVCVLILLHVCYYYSSMLLYVCPHITTRMVLLLHISKPPACMRSAGRSP